MANEFSRTRFVALRFDGKGVLWHVVANYRHRPIIAGQLITTEPWSFALFSAWQPSGAGTRPATNAGA
jgi:hypothetical protein